jgi:hypothetical protein
MISKRLINSVLLGLVAGLLCYLGGKYGAHMVFGKRMVLGLLLNRAMIGFVIGVTSWKLNYVLRGAIIGILVSSLMAVYAPLQGAIMVTLFGMVYGIVIDWLVTGVMKLK